MCCSPDHLGPPPEWYREAAAELAEAGEVIPPPPWNPLVTLDAWARFLGTARGHAPRPASTEGGHGRALPTFRTLASGERERDDGWETWPAAGDCEPAWAQRPPGRAE